MPASTEIHARPLAWGLLPEAYLVCGVHCLLRLPLGRAGRKRGYVLSCAELWSTMDEGGRCRRARHVQQRLRRGVAAICWHDALRRAVHVDAAHSGLALTAVPRACARARRDHISLAPAVFTNTHIGTHFQQPVSRCVFRDSPSIPPVQFPGGRPKKSAGANLMPPGHELQNLPSGSSCLAKSRNSCSAEP